MKGRRAWKKALAGVLTGALLIGTLSTVSASTAVSDVDASGWWVAHSEGIPLTAGTETTITFTGTTYSDATANWNTPLVVVYSADEPFTGGSGISDISGYTEYYVLRSDVYGWEGAGSLGASYTAVSTPYDDTEWAYWFSACKSGVEGTVKAVLIDSTLIIDYSYNFCESIVVITIDPTKPVYISLTGESCTLSNIQYEVTDTAADYEVAIYASIPYAYDGETVMISEDATAGSISLSNLDAFTLTTTISSSDLSSDDYKINTYSSTYQEFTAYAEGTMTASVTLADANGTLIATDSVSCDIIAAPTVTFSNLPESFTVGDSLTLDGASLTETYADGTTKTLVFDENLAEDEEVNDEEIYYYYIAEFYDEDDNYVYEAEKTGSVYVIVTRYNSSYKGGSAGSFTIDPISVTAYEQDHTHTYTDQNITWTWADDYSSATAVLTCDSCSNTVTLTATVADTTGDSSIIYTATVSYNDVAYSDTVEVALSDSADDSEAENTEDADTEDADSEDANSEDADSEGNDSEEETITLEETTITSTTAWSAITTSDLTVSGDSTTTYTVTIDEAYGDDWFSVEVYDGNGNYITLNSDGTYWYYGTEGDDIVMTGSAIILEEGVTYTVELVRDGSDFTVTFYDEDGNELLSYYAANTNIDETAATHVYAQIGSYTVSGEATGTAVESLDTTGEDNSESTENENTEDNSSTSSSSSTNGTSTTNTTSSTSSPKTGDASLLLLALMAAFGCMITAISCKKKFLG